MFTKVLHGEGKPRIVVTKDVLITSTITSVNNVYWLQLSGNPVLNDNCLYREVTTYNQSDGVTKGKIISYVNESKVIRVEAWDNLIPYQGKNLSIKDLIIDLPYCQNNLIETFSIDALPTKKLYSNGRLVIKIRGFYYSVILDYTGYSNLALLSRMQDVYDSTRTNSFRFYPRKDNVNVYYDCEINPESEFSFAQLQHHQGHRLVQFNFICLDRLTKPELVNSLYDVLGVQNINMHDSFIY